MFFFVAHIEKIFFFESPSDKLRHCPCFQIISKYQKIFLLNLHSKDIKIFTILFFNYHEHYIFLATSVLFGNMGRSQTKNVTKCHTKNFSLKVSRILWTAPYLFAFRQMIGTHCQKQCYYSNFPHFIDFKQKKFKLNCCQLLFDWNSL